MSRARVTAAAAATVVLAGLMAPVAGTSAAAADLSSTVYAAAYLGADELAETSLPETVSDGSTAYPVTWSFDAETFAVPYATVPVRGTADGQTVTAQVEVIPPSANPLVYFVDAGHNGDSQSLSYSNLPTNSRAFGAVSSLAGSSLRNTLPDQRYAEGATDWGYTYGGTNNLKISTVGGDPNPSDAATLGSFDKYELGLRTNGSQIAYRLSLDPGTYTLSSGFLEYYTGNRTRGIRPTITYMLDGAPQSQPLDIATLTSSNAGTRSMSTTVFTIPEGSSDVSLVYAQVSGEGPCLSWFAVATGDVERTIENAVAAAAATVGVTVDANAIAADNVNGLTFKGFGVLSGNSTSALLLDYKAEHPEAYAELLQVLFGGEHPIMNHVKIEMGNDRNNSTGPDPATMRTETEEANVTRHPGFQLAADALKVNPDVKVSILRWNAPAWANTNDKVYTWYKNTILAAYREYGFMVDYVNPGVNESTPNFTWTKDYANRVRTDSTGYVSTDPALAGFRPGEADLYHQIQVVISDEAGLGSFGDDMVADATLREAVAVAGYHYTTDDTGAKDFTRLAEVFDKEVWNSEAQATFSNSSFRPNNNTADPSVAGTGIGGTNGPLEMANTIVKGFVNSRRTHFIYQPAIGSFYEGGQYSYKELVSARDPWSGWIHYDAGLAVLQHFSSFANAGWENDTNTAGIWRVVPQASSTGATGTNPVNGRNGLPNYMTLAAPDKSAFSTVVVNDSEYPRTYKITPQNFTFGAGTRLAVWETRAADDGSAFNANYKRHVADVAPSVAGAYTVQVQPYSIVTVTSLDVSDDDTWTAPLPVEGERTVLDVDPDGGTLWSDDFDYSDRTVPVIAAGGVLTGQTEPFIQSRGGADGAIPLYTWDRNGAFEASATPDGYVLRQQVDQTATGVGGAWNGADPITGIGDLRWVNYTASVDVLFEREPSPGNYAAIGARSTGGGSSHSLSGTPYALRLNSEGTWQLLRTGTTVSGGSLVGFDAAAWHTLAIQVAGTRVTGFVDGVQVAALTDTSPFRSGRVDLASGFRYTQFDNLTIERVPGYAPYYTELLDNLELNDLADPPVARLVYDGSWRHANGGGMYEYQRSSSTSQAAGASVSYTFTGTGLDVLGVDNGSARLDVLLDGELVAMNQSTRTSTNYQQTYSLRGLPYGEHTVTLAVTTGTLAVDAVGVVQTPPDEPPSTAALAQAVAEAEAVERDEDFTDADWDLLQADIALARQAVADPVTYGLDVEGAQQLVDWLRLARLPLANSVQSLPQVWKATFVDGSPGGLPANLTATLTDGTTQSVPIAWELDGVDFGQPWTTVAVTGTYGSASTTAWVEVVPRGLSLFADLNATAASSLGYDSPAYLAVAGLLGGTLINDRPDQVFQGSATWGHYGQNSSGTRDLQYKGIVAGDYSKLTTTGFFTANQVGATVSYTFPLSAGRHTIVAGTYSWWASTSRSFNVFLDYDGTSHQVASNVVLDTATASRLLSYDITLEADGPVKLRLVATNNQSPLLSWVAAVDGAYGTRYDANGGSGTVPEPRAGLLWSDTQLDAAADGLTRTDFAFSGWNTAADGTGIAVTGSTPYSALAADPSVAEVTLYAQWRPSAPFTATGGSATIAAGGLTTFEADPQTIGTVTSAVASGAPPCAEVTADTDGVVEFDARDCPAGSHVFDVTFSDSFGRDAVASYTVTVQAPPTASTGSAVVTVGGTHRFAAGPRTTGTIVSAEAVGVAACAEVTASVDGTVDFDSGDCSPGVQEFRVVFTDDLGQTGTAAFTVTVRAAEAPVSPSPADPDEPQGSLASTGLGVAALISLALALMVAGVTLATHRRRGRHEG